MGKIGDVYYVVSLDAQGIPQLAKKEGDKAGKAFGTSMSGGIKKQLKGAFSGGKGELLGALGIGAGIGLATVGLHKLVDVMGDSVTAASNLAEAVSKSKAVFTESSDEMEAWAETASEAFGQSKRQALEAAGTFGNLIQAFGIGADKSAEMSKSLVVLASDLASFNNTSVDDAIIALRAGLSGETEPLKRFGVALNDVRLKEEAMRLGLIKTTKGILPITIKTQAAYSLILKDTALAQGDFGRTSGGLANTQKSLAAAFEDAQAALGEALLPVMVEVVEFVRDEFVPVLKELGKSFSDMGEAAADNAEPMGNLSNLLHDLFKDPQEDAKTFLGALFDGMNDILELASDINDAWTFWDTYESRADEAARKTEELAEATREAGRGIGVAESAAADATPVIEDLGVQGQRAGRKLQRAGHEAAESFKDWRDRVIGYARDIIDKAYQVIEDKAELTATNQEIRDLERIRSTRKWTSEEAARYTELTHRQVELVVDLAANGVKSGKLVNQSMAQLRARLKTSVGEERAAIWAAIKLLRQLQRAADLAKIKSAAAAAAAKKGLGSSALIGGNWGPGQATGGPVQANTIYPVNELPNQVEYFVPNVAGTMYPDAQSLQSAMGSGGGDTFDIDVNLLDRMAVHSPRDIGAGLRMLGEQGYFKPRKG